MQLKFTLNTWGPCEHYFSDLNQTKETVASRFLWSQFFSRITDQQDIRLSFHHVSALPRNVCSEDKHGLVPNSSLIQLFEMFPTSTSFELNLDKRCFRHRQSLFFFERLCNNKKRTAIVSAGARVELIARKKSKNLGILSL
jgi:hypothetical protein